MNDIVEAYKKDSGDDLSDLNEKQIKAVVELAYEEGHYAGIDECVAYMYEFVGLARAVLDIERK